MSQFLINFHLPLAKDNNVNVGDKVIVYPWVHCGICKPCVQGACNLCSGQYNREIGQCDQGG